MIVSKRAEVGERVLGGDDRAVIVHRFGLLAEQRVQERPDVVEHARLRLGGRMDAVGLEQVERLGEAVEKEGHERHLELRASVAKVSAKRSAYSRP